jgi:glycosyltransferase involved in cell wall biosynthesis
MKTMRRRLRVLMVNHSYGRWMNRLALRDLAEPGDIDVYVLAPESLAVGQKTIYLEPDVEPAAYHLVASRVRWSAWRGPYYDAMPRVVRDVKPDIIFVGYEPGSLTALQAAALARRYRSRVICIAVDNINRTLTGGARERLHDRRLAGAAGMALAALIERITLGRISYLLTYNEEARVNYNSYRRYTGPSAFVPLGVDLEQFRPMDVAELKRQLGLTEFVFGYFGRISPEKGIHLLVEAVAQLQPRCQLLIDRFADTAGDKQYLADLIELAQARGIANRIVFFDADHTDMPRYMNCADCAVLPSLTTARMKEQYGRVIPEAMACNVPVVGSSSGTIPYMIGDAGLIFPEGDVGALQDSLARIMRDASLRQRLAGEGRKRAATVFSLQVEVDTYRQVFHELATATEG